MVVYYLDFFVFVHFEGLGVHGLTPVVFVVLNAKMCAFEPRYNKKNWLDQVLSPT